MANKDAEEKAIFGGSMPPRMTRAEWAKRDKTRVTLSRNDLDYLAQVVRAGQVLLRDNRSISAQLKQAMTKLGVSTKGL
jgi:hypothetical protein